MKKRIVERIILWTLTALTAIGLVVVTVVVFDELGTLQEQVGALAEANMPPVAETPEAQTPPHRIAIAGVQVLTGSVKMTVTVRAHGAGDLLYEPPVLQSEEGLAYPVDDDCLEEARLAFLDLVTKGQATARFEFAGRLRPTTQAWLVFNPGREAGDPIAPRVRVPVPVQ